MHCHWSGYSSINQSIHPPIMNQPTKSNQLIKIHPFSNQATNQSTNQSIHPSINQPIIESIKSNQLIKINQSINQPIHPSIHQSMPWRTHPDLQGPDPPGREEDGGAAGGAGEGGGGASHGLKTALTERVETRQQLGATVRLQAHRTRRLAHSHTVRRNTTRRHFQSTTSDVCEQI